MSAFDTFPRVTPFLWFNQNAEEAVEFYLPIFQNSRRLHEARRGDKETDPILTIGFELDGQKFTAINGGPMYQFSEAVSFVILCDTQEEVDHYWSNLTAGGKEIQCGWLKDKFGLCWQVVPKRLPQLLRNPKVMQAMMPMKKLIIAELEAAAK